MLVAISTFLGFIGGFVPELLKLWREKQAHTQELEKMKLQAEIQEKLHQQRLEEVNVQADIDEQRVALEASRVEELKYTGNKWLDAPIVLANVLIMLVNGLVRATITYSYFWLYAWVKYATWLELKEVANRNQATIRLWTETDEIIFGSVIGFWFGSRTMKWMKEKWR